MIAWQAGIGLKVGQQCNLETPHTMAPMSCSTPIFSASEPLCVSELRPRPHVVDRSTMHV